METKDKSYLFTNIQVNDICSRLTELCEHMRECGTCLRGSEEGYDIEECVNCTLDDTYQMIRTEVSKGDFLEAIIGDLKDG